MRTWVTFEHIFLHTRIYLSPYFKKSISDIDSSVNQRKPTLICWIYIYIYLFNSKESYIFMAVHSDVLKCIAISQLLLLVTMNYYFMVVRSALQTEWIWILRFVISTSCMRLRVNYVGSRTSHSLLNSSSCYKTLNRIGFLKTLCMFLKWRISKSICNGTRP